MACIASKNAQGPTIPGAADRADPVGGERAQARLIRQEVLPRVMGKTVVKTVPGNTVLDLAPRARGQDWCLARKRIPMMASGKCCFTGRT